MKKLIKSIEKLVSKNSDIDIHKLNYISNQAGTPIPKEKIDRLKKEAHVHTYKQAAPIILK